MAELLSQEEIDALLNNVGSSDAGAVRSSPAPKSARMEQRDASIYDFKRPNRVSKDQLRSLQIIHDGFVRLIAGYLAGYLRTLVEINLISVDQLTFGEYVMSLSNPTSIGVFAMEPLEGNAVVEMNSNLAFSMMDRLLGGQGKVEEQKREFTAIENAIVDKIFQFQLKALSEAWATAGEFRFTLVSQESNPQFVQIASPGDIVILVTLEMKIDETSGILTVAYPYMLLESTLPHLSGRQYDAHAGENKKPEKMLKNVEFSSNRVSVDVGGADMTLKDLMFLQEGDVVKLNRNLSDDFVMRIGGVAKFLAKPGVFKGYRSIQITQAIHEGEVM